MVVLAMENSVAVPTLHKALFSYQRPALRIAAFPDHVLPPAGSVSTAPSSALVRLGKTSLVCGVTLEIAPPELSRPNEGFIGTLPRLFVILRAFPDTPFPLVVPNVDLSPLCSPLFRPGPPADEAQVLSSRLRDVLLACVCCVPSSFLSHTDISSARRSNIIPLSSLVIEPGKAVWVVYLDVVCLNYDGGILDAAVLAAVGALKNRTSASATFFSSLF